MSFITDQFIKKIYNFSYPTCCSNWNNPGSINTINEYGILLKKFTSIVNNYDKQLKHANNINILLNNQYTNNEIVESLKIYNNLKVKRKESIRQSQLKWFGKLSPIIYLSDDNDEVWGSKRQYLYGYICSNIMKNQNIALLPFMCSALNPTGGICGAGNQSLYSGDIYSAIIVHSCIHDASGYCYNYHNIGKGYNYLNTYFAFPTKFPMSCQIMGIFRCWYLK
jgi:hypothetical protein